VEESQEDHRRYRPLKLSWVLFLGAFGLFFLVDLFSKDFSYEKQERKSFSEAKTFFGGSDQEVEVYHLHAESIIGRN
jgi:hypothetical protein